MGEVQGCEELGGSLPNGLLPGTGPVMQAVDTDRWLKAEERTAELISCIQPNQLSEQRRSAVSDYVQRLIKKCFPCEVKTFGSVPLKTYLPDGDIDLTLTAISNDQNLKDTWANQVRDMLENEEKNVNAEFHVKEVQYIQAEVKIIKCLVENIVVDISFNQVGGLCTLCFLIEIDNRIKQNHLFKRSIILIKAWCYYESRILGAHHGLISTYALETLVLYIFHVFSNSFHGPLEVLYRFLEFFSKFDWDNFCISLWGPVPICALPDVTAEPPRKDSRELLHSKMFLDACSSVYAVFPVGQENNGQPFVSKHFNVIDPLRVNNNLGRSVSKGNFFRIRSAFAFGAKKLARLLNCSKENLTFEVNQFFMNTLERHGTGHRPDAPGLDSRSLRSLTPDSPQKFEILKNNTSGKNVNESSSVRGMDDEGIHSRGVSSRTHSLKKHLNSTSLRDTGKIRRDIVSDQVVLDDEIQRYPKSDHLVTDSQGRFIFPRTRSSPELTDMYGDVSSHASRTKTDSTNTHARLVTSNRRKNLGSESLANHNTRSSVEDTSSVREYLSQQSLDADADSKSGTNNFHRELGLDREISSSTTHIMHQEQEDIANMVASASLEGFNGQFHLPFSLTSDHLPFPIPPSFLASMGYAQQNFRGHVPTNIPFMDPSFPNMIFSHGLVPPKLIHNFPNFGLNTPSDDSIELTNENFGDMEMNSRELDGDIGQGQDVDSSVGYDLDNGNSDTRQLNDKQSASSSGLKYVPPFRVRVQQKHSREKHESVPENVNSFPIQDSRTGEVYAEERPSSSRFSSATRNSSLRSRTSSESSRDGSVKTPKATKERRGKQVVSTDLAPVHGKGKIVFEHGHVSNQVEGDDQDQSLLLDASPEMIERNCGPESVSSLQFPRHHIPGSDVAQTSGSDSIPFGPMLICPGPGQMTGDNSGMVPFYPAGPPVPFLTMLYKAPSKTGISDASSVHFRETLDTTDSEQNFSPRGFDQSDHLGSSSSLRGSPAIETSEEQKSDNILATDVDGHKNNLRFERLSQNPQPLLYPSPVMVPPAYLQGRFQYDNTVKPHWTSSNILSQLMASNGHRVVPPASLPSVSGRPPNVYQRYVDDMPRYRSGTGTYLPNPAKVSLRGHSSGTRRGNYNHDRNGNYGDREGNWNGISKSRGAARGHTRNQTDKSNSRTERLASNESRADRSRNSYKSESIPPHQLQNGPVHSSSTQNGPQNVAYTMYPLAASNPNGNHDEPLEFGSLGGPGGIQSINEQSELNEGTGARIFEDHRPHGNSGQRSSPDQPSSPRHQREHFPRKRR